MFEGFISGVAVNESTKGLESCEFQWLTFDNYKGPLNFEKMDLEGLKKLSEESGEKGNAAEIGDAGIFICHIKQPDGGFTRIITEVNKSIDPLTFEVSTWDSNLKMKFKNEGVTLEELPVLVSKGRIFSRFI